MYTFARPLNRALRTAGESPAVVCQDNRRTYAELGSRCRRLAGAMHTLGLEPDATEKEIDAALAAEELKRRQGGLNGSDHAIAARIDAAREILRGKEGS